MSLPGMRKPSVSELADHHPLHFDYQGLPLLFYCAALPLPRKTLNFAAGVIRRHPKSTGSRWRAPSSYALRARLPLRSAKRHWTGCRVHRGARGSRGGHHIAVPVLSRWRFDGPDNLQAGEDRTRIGPP